MKYEWKKEEKYLYGAKQKPAMIEVPSQRFIMISGQGNPNEADFANRVSALYSLAYGIKMLYKKLHKGDSDATYTDFTVYPLEGIWENASEEEFDKNKLKYKIMIKQPDFITKDIFDSALENVKQKKHNSLYDEITLEDLEGTRAIQVLHIGSFDTEPFSFKKMEEMIKENDLVRTSNSHIEIYLSNKNRTAEEKLKTILRYNLK